MNRKPILLLLAAAGFSLSAAALTAATTTAPITADTFVETEAAPASPTPRKAIATQKTGRAGGNLSGAAAPFLPATVTMSRTELADKIKGGWAGQAIGCAYGGPTEFVYPGTMIQDYIPIDWPAGRMKSSFENTPGLYDDVYMDLTFVRVIDSLGVDAPVAAFAETFAHAGYSLWHANQAARYNILHGIPAPESGHWRNNPHADDIDYQIEADFAGLMSPGMPNSASEISDRVGHIMCYGDGWYGGVYVGAMYALAFVSDDIPFIVSEALKTIPGQSTFAQCMRDVIHWHAQYPDDWKQTWFECERKWSSDKGCPEGVFVPYNIDALINSAYVVIGLLYGEGDYARTMEIATRCGQDSDCNPATAAGILGTAFGYSRIPEKWLANLHQIEEMNFPYTDISLNKVSRMGLEHAQEMIRRGGGCVGVDSVTIRCQQPVPVRYEVAFEGIYPVQRNRWVRKDVKANPVLSFEGTGVVLLGEVKCADRSYSAQVEVYVDGKLAETADLPADYKTRRIDLFWRYDLPKARHEVSLRWLNPREDASLKVSEMLVYSDAPSGR